MLEQGVRTTSIKQPCWARRLLVTVAHAERTNRALREGAQRLRRVARCNVEIYSTKAKIRRRTIASFHSVDIQPPDSGLVISRIYRSPHTGISRVPWTNLSILPSITSWTRETGKTPLFAFESLVKSDGGELSDFATGPSPFPDTPWQEAQDRRNSFRPAFSSGCACRTSIVLIIAEAANKAKHHVVRISLHPCVFALEDRSLPCAGILRASAQERAELAHTQRRCLASQVVCGEERPVVSAS